MSGRAEGAGRDAPGPPTEKVSRRVRASRRLMLEHAMMDEARYLRPAARLSEALEATEAASRGARRLRDAGRQHRDSS